MTPPDDTAATTLVAELSPELLQLLSADPAELVALCSDYPPVDVAAALKKLPAATAVRVIGNLPFEFAVQVLDDPLLTHHRYDVIRLLELGRAGALIEAMSADQQAGLIRELPKPERDRYLAVLAPATRVAIEQILRFRADSAGGIMTTEYTSVAPDVTAADALAYVRRVATTKETIYAIYIIDPGTHRLEGVISLRELLLADPNAAVLDEASAVSLVTVTPATDRQDVAQLIGRYNLLAVPVVDSSKRLMGIVTVDDVIDAMVKEQTEQVQKMGGVGAIDTPYTEISFTEMIKKRAGWLCVLFLGEMLTATAMGHFEGEIAHAVVLSLFVPLIISSGGNSGSQATSLIIRALALKEVKLSDWWRVALRELPAGLILGAFLGVIGITRILVWEGFGWYDYGPHYLLVALTVGISLVGVVTFGSLAGSMLPFALRRLGFDPASASAPFVATLVDVSGLVIYFTVALLILRGTLL